MTDFGVRGWLVILGSGIFLLQSPQVMAGPKCTEILKEKCQGCHALARTCAELGRDKEDWQQSISQMASYSATISASDQKTLVKCLVKQEKEVVELCRP